MNKFIETDDTAIEVTDEDVAALENEFAKKPEPEKQQLKSPTVPPSPFKGRKSIFEK